MWSAAVGGGKRGKSAQTPLVAAAAAVEEVEIKQTAVAADHTEAAEAERAAGCADLLMTFLSQKKTDY